MPAVGKGDTSSVASVDVGAAGINSLRAYRSRRARPCDRCRSRKQRCVILEIANGTKCLNCELSASECRFEDPPPVNPANAARARKRAETTGNTPPSQAATSGASNSSNQASSSGTPAAAQSPTYPAQSQTLPQQPAPPSLPATGQQSGMFQPSHQPIATPPLYIPHLQPMPPPHLGGLPMGYFSPSAMHTPQRARLSDLVRNIAQASSNSAAYAQMAQPAEEFSALDLEADEETELFLVGTAAERDALRLSTAAGANSSASQSGQKLRVRHVSRDPNHPVAFLYLNTKPYYEPPVTFSVLDELIRVVGHGSIDKLMQDYLRIDAAALPIWSQEHFAANPNLNPGLQASYITSALVYTPALRNIQHDCWGLCRAFFRMRDPRARLSTIQATLIDLNGRHGVDPAGNFVRLGTAVSVAKLLGLHLPCSTWTIPMWERDLRSRLWWALLIYDRVSAITFGRAAVISNDEREVGLPRRSPQDSPSYDSFVSLCELSVILGDLNRHLRSPAARATYDPSGVEGVRQHAVLHVLDDASLKLDRWKNLVDSRRLFNFPPGEAPPGIRSLELVYEYTALVIARESWDACAADGGAVAILGQRTCLQAATEFVDFICNLAVNDLEGYWQSNSAFFISTCLTVLVRLTLESDRTDRSETAIWQSAIFSLRRLISRLSDARREAEWDIADLALSRAHYFLPLLSRQAPEFQLVLQPLQSAMPAPPVDEDLEQFLQNFVTDNYSQHFDAGF